MLRDGLRSRRRAPVATEQRGLGNPVGPFPEAPHEDALHRRMGKADAIVIDDGLSFVLFFLRGHLELTIATILGPLAGEVEFRDDDREFELRQLIQRVLDCDRIKRIVFPVSIASIAGQDRSVSSDGPNLSQTGPLHFSPIT